MVENHTLKKCFNQNYLHWMFYGNNDYFALINAYNNTNYQANHTQENVDDMDMKLDDVHCERFR